MKIYTKKYINEQIVIIIIIIIIIIINAIIIISIIIIILMNMITNINANKGRKTKQCVLCSIIISCSNSSSSSMLQVTLRTFT